MTTRLSILAVVFCCAASYSYSQTTAVSDQSGSSPRSTSKQTLPGGDSEADDHKSPHPRGPLTTLGTGYAFTEGPAVDRHGNVYFTDQPNDRIYRWDAGKHGEGMDTEGKAHAFDATKITLFLEGTGRANGMAFDRDGNLITCSDMHGEVWKIYPDGSHDVLVNNYGGKLLNGPNDVWINPVNGGMYFTDPIFPRSYWDANDPRQQAWEPTHSEQAPVGKGGYVYYLRPGGKALVRVTTEAMGWDSDGWPNGVVGTPDGRKLYVNKWYYDSKGGTWVFDINPDGTLSNMRKFSDWGGDGMSMDELGDIYISNGYGVMVFDPDGNNILTIPTGPGAGTNNTFAGRDDKLLFITDSAGSVLGIKMNVKGAPNW